MTALVKWIGSACILFAGGTAAYYATRFEKQRLSVLDSWIDLLFYIRGQIDCYLTPIDEILASADKTLLHACMRSVQKPTLPSLLRASSLWLTPESQRLLDSMAREMGTSYREEQVKRCDYYMELLRVQREKIAKELPGRVKLCITLCLCSSIGIAILFW